MTHYWVVALTDTAEHPIIQAAAQLVRDGKQVAFPTETVYGLGADARNTAAVEGIFQAKGRPADNPLIVHISHVDQLASIVSSVDPVSRKLMDAFWPGPLTLVLPAAAGAVSPRVTAGLATVAVRMPAHPTALSLITAAGCPLAAPSANRSGRPSPTRAEHVRDDLDGRIEAIIDAGPTGVGVESTVVEVVDDVIHILRPGGITYDQLLPYAKNGVIVEAEVTDTPKLSDAERSLAGHLANHVFDQITPKSPGMKYAHYAPQGKLTLIKGSDSHAVSKYIQQMIDEARLLGETTGVLACVEHVDRYQADLVVACGSIARPESIAHDLFAALRRFDEAGIKYIAAEAFNEAGIGSAVMNRLMKAAGQNVIDL
jgi:L-threonylcarbamoyladenylate synthase